MSAFGAKADIYMLAGARRMAAEHCQAAGAVGRVNVSDGAKPSKPRPVR